MADGMFLEDNKIWCGRDVPRCRKARIHTGEPTGRQPVCAGGYVPQGDCERPMGRYIDDILQPGEKLLYSTNLHWVFYLAGVVGWAVSIALLIGSRSVTPDSLVLVCLVLSAAAALVAVYLSFRAWFKRWTTETDVTSLRVVHKEGFIKRRTFEMSLDKVESVDVNQSILGRILNYGDVTIRGVGEGVEKIKTIASPLAFRNFITAR
jgi:membrane protein YdbS with pleckstrin-like domain